MANHTPKQVEDAIIVALKAGMTYLKTCESYGGQLEDALSRYAGPLPAVFVEYDSRRFEGEDAEVQLFSTPWAFTIYVVTSGLYNEEQSRRGTSGCYEMLEDVKTALAGKTAGLLEFLPFKPAGEQIVMNDGRAVAYALQITGESYYHVT